MEMFSFLESQKPWNYNRTTLVTEGDINDGFAALYCLLKRKLLFLTKNDTSGK